MNALELARKSDAQTCYEIIEQAKAFQREQASQIGEFFGENSS